jgi:hypothetical protein
MKRSPIRLVSLMDRADVRRLGFALEAAHSLRVVGKIIGTELQGDVVTELHVFRLVHHAHAPAAERAEDAVMGKPSGLRVVRGLALAGMLRVDLARINLSRLAMGTPAAL